VLKSFGFLAGALILGSFLAKPISKLFSKINTGLGMKVTLAISLALLFGYLAEVFGLEPIIGAFAAGLLLDAVHFDSFADPGVINELKSLEPKNKADKEAVQAIIRRHRHANIEDLVNNIGFIFIPIFFVFAGLQIDFGSLLKPNLYVIAGAISIVAIASKVIAGFASKGSLREKLLVGFSMVPRGEVGLVFAATGSALGVLTPDEFSVIVIVIIVTTFIAPFAIKKLAKDIDESGDHLPQSRYKNLFKDILSKRPRFNMQALKKNA
jgi:Kef-type K+ transport system membrane component KefB